MTTLNPCPKNCGLTGGCYHCQAWQPASPAYISPTIHIPPLNLHIGRYESCAKCRSNDVGIAYHAEDSLTRNCDRFGHSKRKDAHLHITCRTCRFDWCIDVAKGVDDLECVNCGKMFPASEAVGGEVEIPMCSPLCDAQYNQDGS